VLHPFKPCKIKKKGAYPNGWGTNTFELIIGVPNGWGTNTFELRIGVPNL